MISIYNFSFQLVIFTPFFIIHTMKGKIFIKHYEDLFTEYGENSLFLKLQKNLTPIFESLGLKDKDVILAVSG